MCEIMDQIKSNGIEIAELNETLAYIKRITKI